MIPVDTVFFGNNITARTRDGNSLGAGTYIDPNIVLSKGVLQEFHYYISDPYAEAQTVYFNIWEIVRRTGNGEGGDEITVELKFELEHTLGTEVGPHKVRLPLVLSIFRCKMLDNKVPV